MMMILTQYNEFSNLSILGSLHGVVAKVLYYKIIVYKF